MVGTPQCRGLSTLVSTRVMDPHLAATTSLPPRAAAASAITRKLFLASAITGKLSAFLIHPQTVHPLFGLGLFLSEQIFETLFAQHKDVFKSRRTAACGHQTLSVLCPNKVIFVRRVCLSPFAPSRSDTLIFGRHQLRGTEKLPFYTSKLICTL